MCVFVCVQHHIRMADIKKQSEGGREVCVCVMWGGWVLSMPVNYLLKLAFPKQCLWYVVLPSTICVRAACNKWTGLHSARMHAPTHTLTHTNTLGDSRHPRSDGQNYTAKPSVLTQSKRSAVVKSDAVVRSCNSIANHHLQLCSHANMSLKGCQELAFPFYGLCVKDTPSIFRRPTLIMFIF